MPGVFANFLVGVQAVTVNDGVVSTITCCGSGPVSNARGGPRAVAGWRMTVSGKACPKQSTGSVEGPAAAAGLLSLEGS